MTEPEGRIIRFPIERTRQPQPDPGAEVDTEFDAWFRGLAGLDDND